MKQHSTITAYLAQTMKDNWSKPALTNLGSITYNYCDVAATIAKLHIAFRALNLQPGDKIAFCAKNSAELATGMIASITYGTITVPILHEFTPDTLHHLVNHCEAKALFTEPAIWKNLDPEKMPDLRGAIYVGEFQPVFSRSEALNQTCDNLNKLFGEAYPRDFTAEDINYFTPDNDAVALINYTSGSAGFSKGVMLTYSNLWSNLQYCFDGLDFLKSGDNMLCMLPLAHMFGLMTELLHTFSKGCHLYFLSRTPSPAVLLQAFAEVRPKLIITVPLILEKMVKSRVFPLLEKPAMKIAMRIPGMRGKILNKIKEKFNTVFGGNLQEMIIGGAGLNKEVEVFLRKIQFPYTVGYGMTECGPLICHAPWHLNRPTACGRVVPRMELRIDSVDPLKIPGTLWVKGQNVMKGYFKDQAATDAVFEDGWMNTGDICQTDKDGFIYIRGRDKNMILGPSGQNIYPEEIEQVLNNMPLVAESIVVDRDNKLIAIIHPDYDSAKEQNLDDEAIKTTMAHNLEKLNKAIPAYSRVSSFEIHKDEFEKTPKHSIKRYLYMKK